MFQDTGSDVGGRYPQRKSGMRLITQRSQVQILPPLQVKSQVSNLEPFGLAVAREDSLRNLRVRGPFDLRIGGAFCIAVCSWYPRPSTGRTWIPTAYRDAEGPSDPKIERASDAKIPCGIFASHGEPEGL